MQIQSSQAIERRVSAIRDNQPAKPSCPKQAPVLASGKRAASLIPHSSLASSSSASTASRPQYQEDHEPPLAPALQAALRQDDWPAFTAALNDSTMDRIAEPGLMHHAARAGASRIAFRLQSRADKPVSPFAPDMKSGAFYTAIRHGNDEVAAAMLDYHTRIEEKEVPDLKPCLVAAVDDNEGRAITWLVDYSLGKKCTMPFEFLAHAIREGNARRIEIMISHPAFAKVLNDTEAEHGVLAYAIRKGAASTLGILLARKRVSANRTWLCEKTGPKGNTLLHLAAASGDPEKLKMILDFDPETRREGASDSFFARLFQGDAIDARNGDGKTALAIAVDAGHKDLAALLAARGAR